MQYISYIAKVRNKIKDAIQKIYNKDKKQSKKKITRYNVRDKAKDAMRKTYSKSKSKTKDTINNIQCKRQSKRRNTS